MDTHDIHLEAATSSRRHSPNERQLMRLAERYLTAEDQMEANYHLYHFYPEQFQALNPMLTPGSATAVKPTFSELIALFHPVARFFSQRWGKRAKERLAALPHRSAPGDSNHYYVSHSSSDCGGGE